jgi:CRISPR-associated protein Csc3
MTTLLQTLLLQTLNPDTDPVLCVYMETVLPAIEQEFGMIPALGGSEEAQYHLLRERGNNFQDKEPNTTLPSPIKAYLPRS